MEVTKPWIDARRYQEDRFRERSTKPNLPRDFFRMGY